MSNDDLFSFLGATEKESATYLRLLALGAQPMSVIARHMNLPRSSMYSIHMYKQAEYRMWSVKPGLQQKKGSHVTLCTIILSGKLQ